ncbi:Uncharacterized protein EJ110_NYTH46446 [Nymphaea thermarum]|nr:Uncharacterized protein EJ110_NYTH46446 [Nymphaea thermarum]
MGTCLSKKNSLNEEGSAPAAPPSAAVAPSGSASRKATTLSGSDAKAVKRASSGAGTAVEKVTVRKSNARETEKPAKPKAPLADISNLKADNEGKPGKLKVEEVVPPVKGREANGGDDNGNGCPPKQSTDDAAALKKGSDGVVRTSSCTKEEVDAILIQCGRLSRSSSGKSSNENNARALTSSASTKRHSGSKRHFEYQAENENQFDREGGDDGRGKQRSGRPSHKRTPSGDMGGMVDYYYKRSSSRERNPDEQRARRGGAAAAAAGSEARRRVSRSPGKRGDATPDKSKSTRSGRYAPSSSADTGGKPVAKRNNVASRSRSPAARAATATTPTVPTPSLSRNSSRKGEQSPYRRPLVGDSLPKSHGQADNSADPVTTITTAAAPTTTTTIAGDRNKSSSSGNHQNVAKDREGEREEKVRNPSASHRRSESLDGSGKARDSRGSNTPVPHIREQLLTCRVVKQVSRQQPSPTMPISDHRQPEPEEDEAAAEDDAQVTAESLTLDAESCYPQKKLTRSMFESGNPASPLDNDVRSPAFYLPPCVSKACSILEAVADLNSNSTVPRARDPLELLDLHNGNNVDDHHHVTDRNLHKYVSARREIPHQPASSEGQESSGSNTVLTTSSAWEPASADSTDRWVDGRLFQKFIVPEEEENSSSSSAYRFQSLPAGVRDDASENLKAASTNYPSSEQDKRAAGRYDASDRATCIASGRAHAGQKFIPVITLSNSMKREVFHNDRNAKALNQSSHL